MAGANGMKSIAFNMSPNTSAGAYYIDNVVLEIEKESSGGGIPQTAQEKKDTLTYAMDKWISGMMDACKNEEGTEVMVKAWDVVNEAIEDDGSFRKSKYYNLLGEEFIEIAFRAAHEADPDAELYLSLIHI